MDSEPESEPESDVDSNIGASSEADTVTYSEDEYQRLLLDEHRPFDTDDAATAADSDNDSVYAVGLLKGSGFRALLHCFFCPQLNSVLCYRHF